MRTKHPNKRPLCACGCGNLVEWNTWRQRWNVFIHNHHFKGRHFSKGHKEKIRQANTGKVFSKERKRNISLGQTGKKHSEETKRKIGQASKGRKFSDETKRKISKSHIGIKPSNKIKKKISKIKKEYWNNPKNILKVSGENHHNWKGGISCEPYCIDWTKEYKEYIKSRDNNKCQNPDCWHASDNRSFHVHHINYIKKDCVPKNLITLCNSCNSRANFNREKWIMFYQEIIEQKYKLKKAA